MATMYSTTRPLMPLSSTPGATYLVADSLAFERAAATDHGLHDGFKASDQRLFCAPAPVPNQD